MAVLVVVVDDHHWCTLLSGGGCTKWRALQKFRVFPLPWSKPTKLTTIFSIHVSRYQFWNLLAYPSIQTIELLKHQSHTLLHWCKNTLLFNESCKFCVDAFNMCTSHLEPVDIIKMLHKKKWMNFCFAVQRKSSFAFLFHPVVSSKCALQCVLHRIGG